jgi:hypothetical protein
MILPCQDTRCFQADPGNSGINSRSTKVKFLRAHINNSPYSCTAPENELLPDSIQPAFFFYTFILEGS